MSPMYNSPTYLFHSLEGGNLPNGRSLLSFLGYDTGDETSFFKLCSYDPTIRLWVLPLRESLLVFSM